MSQLPSRDHEKMTGIIDEETSCSVKIAKEWRGSF